MLDMAFNYHTAKIIHTLFCINNRNVTSDRQWYMIHHSYLYVLDPCFDYTALLYSTTHNHSHKGYNNTCDQTYLSASSHCHHCTYNKCPEILLHRPP